MLAAVGLGVTMVSHHYSDTPLVRQCFADLVRVGVGVGVRVRVRVSVLHVKQYTPRPLSFGVSNIVGIVRHKHICRVSD